MLRKIMQRVGSISRMKFFYQRSIEEYNKRQRISDKIAHKIGTSKFDGKSIIEDKKIPNDLETKGYITFGKVLNTSESERL